MSGAHLAQLKRQIGLSHRQDIRRYGMIVLEAGEGTKDASERPR